MAQGSWSGGVANARERTGPGPAFPCAEREFGRAPLFPFLSGRGADLRLAERRHFKAAGSTRDAGRSPTTQTRKHHQAGGNDRQPCFFADEDYRRYLDWLTEYGDKRQCRIHAYALMTNHVHLLLSSDRADAGGALIRSSGSRFPAVFRRGRAACCSSRRPTSSASCRTWVCRRGSRFERTSGAE